MGSGFGVWGLGCGVEDLGLRIEGGQPLHRNVQRFRGGLVFKAHILCASLNSRLESHKKEEKMTCLVVRERLLDCNVTDLDLRG